jgi:hypothetical protein
MKNNYPLLTCKSLFILMLCAIFVNSCGDGSTTNTTNSPAGTVLYSQDSLAVWIQSGSSFARDSIAFSTSETGGFKVEFRVQSNADSSQHSVGYYRYNTNGLPLVVMLPDIYFPIDEQYTSNFNFASGSTYSSFAVKLTTTGTASPFYVRLKNIKITKL